MFVTQADEAQAVVVGTALLAQRFIAFIQLFARNQGIGNVFECGLNSSFISNDLCLLAQFSYVKIGFVCAPVKDRQSDGWRKSPNTRAALKQAAQLAGSCTDRTGQADAWEKRRTCRTDIGISLFERVFGRADIRAVEQYVRTQTGRQFGDFELFAQRQTGRQIFGQRLINQHSQGIARLLAVFHRRGVIGFGRFNQRFLLAQINGGNHAGFMAQLRELVRRFTGLQHTLCQCHTFFGVTLVKVGFGHGRNQGQMCGIAVGGYIKITLQSGFVGAADSAEEVEFIRGYAQTNAVLAADVAAAQAALTRTCTAGVNGRQ